MEEKSKPTPNQKLRHERDRRMWSQQELADRVGTTPLNIGRWERGVTQPGPYFRQKLCAVFEKNAYELGLVTSREDGISIVEQAQPVSISAIAPTTPGQADSPTLWNVPYRRNLLFTGREDILAQLRDAFMSETATIALAQPQAISGLGGIGKTQTAIEYAYRYRDSYQAVFWVRAESPDLLISDYLTLATLLNLPERNDQDQSQITSAVIRWFDTHDSWLLILDNADELDAVSEYIPSAGKGHILLTTRAQAVGTLAQRIDLDKLSLDDGMILLLRRIKRLRGNASLESVPAALRTQAQAIVEAVDCLPLALDQAGAYIEETSCSLSDYLKFYKTRRSKLLRTRGRDVGGHPEPVAATWSLAFENIERANPAAADLLRLCAFLHPDAIPENMIIEGASELGPTLDPIATDELDLNEAIGQLLRYSLVKRDADEKVLNIHRLVQAVVRDGMKDDDERMWAERIVSMMSKVFPEGTEFETWDACQRYLPHAQTSIEGMNKWQMISTKTLPLLNHVGAYLASRAQFNEAKTLLQRSLTKAEKISGSESIIVEALINIGIVYWMQGAYDETVTTLLRAIAIQEQLNPDHLRLAEALNNLGVLYNAQGKHTQAIPLYQQAITIWENAKPLDETMVAYGITNLAVVYDDLGRYDEAETLYKRALSIRQRLQGMEHPEVGTILNNLALVYRSMRRYDEEKIFLEQSLSITRTTMGENHPRVGTSLDNLAQNYMHRGNYEQAEIFYRDSLAVRQRILESEHPDIAFSLFGLASLYRLQKRYVESEELFHQSLAIREKALGIDHPYVATTLNGLGQLYVDQNKYDVAEPIFQRAVTIREEKLGENHPDVATTLEKYASLLRKTNHDTEAEALEARAQAIRAHQA